MKTQASWVRHGGFAEPAPWMKALPGLDMQAARFTATCGVLLSLSKTYGCAAQTLRVCDHYLQCALSAQT
jgi:hypothetical protein